MPKLTIQFSGGIQGPAKLGTVILKPTANGKLAYAQNIQSGPLEYGEGLITPGPSVVNLTNNDDLTGLPLAFTKVPVNNTVLIVEGVVGATNIVREINQVTYGSTPQINDGVSDTIAHSGHTGVVVEDITARETDIFIAGYDATDNWVQYDSGYIAGSLNFDNVTTRTSVPYRIYKSNNSNNIYFLERNASNKRTFLSQIDTTNAFTDDVFSLPRGYQGSEISDWNEVFAIAYNVGITYGIDNRKGQGRSGIILWNYITTNNFVRDVIAPVSYISAIRPSPDGNLIVFGSAKLGLTSIFTFTGYAFKHEYSYIGEPPRNRHSVDFDNEGNVLWQTLDGQICKYNFIKRQFEHITSTIASLGGGGIFTSLLGGTGNEWLAGGANEDSGNTYQIARIVHGNYIGDGDTSTDVYNTPLAISGQQFLPSNSTIKSITLYGNKELASGNKVNLTFYKNGNTTSINYLTMDFSSDGAISAKRKVLSISNVDNFSLGLAYKQSDNSTTTIPIFIAVVEYETTVN